MARTCTARANSQLLVSLANTVDLASGGATVAFNPTLLSISWASGTGVDQCNTVFSGTESLATASTFTIDMYGNDSALDGVGVAVANTKIKLILFRNTTAAGTDAKFVLGGSGAASAFNTIFDGSDDAEFGPISAGGVFMVALPSAAGAAVAATTNQYLKVYNSGAATGTFEFLVVGVQ